MGAVAPDTNSSSRAVLLVTQVCTESETGSPLKFRLEPAVTAPQPPEPATLTWEGSRCIQGRWEASQEVPPKLVSPLAGNPRFVLLLRPTTRSTGTLLDSWQSAVFQFEEDHTVPPLWGSCYQDGDSETVVRAGAQEHSSILTLHNFVGSAGESQAVELCKVPFRRNCPALGKAVQLFGLVLL